MSRQFARRALPALAAALLLVPAAASANLISNGSFEAVAVPNASFTSYGVGSGALSGWTVIGDAGKVVSVVSGTFTQSAINFVAQDGKQWLDLSGENDTNGNGNEGISQTIATTAGATYSLSFWVGNVNAPSATFGVSSSVTVSIDGTAFSATNDVSTTTSLNWKQFTREFVATGTSTVISFRNGDPRGDNSNGLDNIVVDFVKGPETPPPSQVPLPGSLALLGVALGTLGLQRRRRSQR